MINELIIHILPIHCYMILVSSPVTVSLGYKGGRHLGFTAAFTTSPRMG